ncbi:MAG: Septum formation, partial [Nocardioidaceae bacterium]|nr:Septum formation [Nocardioidaceae bacterium]
DLARGAAWLRCDVGFPSDFPERHLKAITGHVESAVTAHPLAHWACLGKAPSWHTSQPLVSCQAPHRYEETGRLVMVPAVSSYPTAKVLARTAPECQDSPLLSGRKTPATTTTVQWLTKAQWRNERAGPNPEFLGTCWLHRADAAPLPPLP